MTDLRKAAEMALEALIYHQEQTRPIHKTQEVITALRQALAQPEQEPQRPVKSYTGGVPRYATDAPKPEWIGLSDEEVAIYSNVFNGIRLVREIEAQLKERNNG